MQRGAALGEGVGFIFWHWMAQSFPVASGEKGFSSLLASLFFMSAGGGNPHWPCAGLAWPSLCAPCSL